MNKLTITTQSIIEAFAPRDYAPCWLRFGEKDKGEACAATILAWRIGSPDALSAFTRATLDGLMNGWDDQHLGAYNPRPNESYRHLPVNVDYYAAYDAAWHASEEMHFKYDYWRGEWRTPEWEAYALNHWSREGVIVVRGQLS